MSDPRARAVEGVVRVWGDRGQVLYEYPSPDGETRNVYWDGRPVPERDLHTPPTGWDLFKSAEAQQNEARRANRLFRESTEQTQAAAQRHQGYQDSGVVGAAAYDPTRPGPAVQRFLAQFPGLSEAELSFIPGFAEGLAQARAQDQERYAHEAIFDLMGRAPSVDDLTVNYRDAGPSQLEGLRASQDQEASQRALMDLYQRGGWTDQDASVARDLRRVSAMERGQQLRGANEAALQQMAARGMGGGGAELAARLSASQGMAQGQAMADASSNAAMQQAAMQRAMQGLTQYGSNANTMQGQEMQRRSAIDAFNQQNTAWRNKSLESRAQAHQTAYQNQERGVEKLVQRYPTSRQDEANRNAAQFGRDAVSAAGDIVKGLVG